MTGAELKALALRIVQYSVTNPNGIPPARLNLLAMKLGAELAASKVDGTLAPAMATKIQNALDAAVALSDPQTLAFYQALTALDGAATPLSSLQAGAQYIATTTGRPNAATVAQDLVDTAANLAAAKAAAAKGG